MAPRAALAFEPDPGIFLQDFGVSVVAGAAQGLGIYNGPGQSALEDGTILVDESILVLADTFGNLLAENPVTVDGEPYVVLEPIPQGDGVFLLLAIKPQPIVSGASLVTLGGDFLVTLDADNLVTL